MQSHWRRFIRSAFAGGAALLLVACVSCSNKKLPQGDILPDTAQSADLASADSLALSLEGPKTARVGDSLLFRVILKNLTARALVLRSFDSRYRANVTIHDSADHLVWQAVPNVTWRPADILLKAADSLVFQVAWDQKTNNPLNPVRPGCYSATGWAFFEKEKRNTSALEITIQ